VIGRSVVEVMGSALSAAVTARFEAGAGVDSPVHSAAAGRRRHACREQRPWEETVTRSSTSAGRRKSIRWSSIILALHRANWRRMPERLEIVRWYGDGT
jgi:hypothetical protein